MQNNNNSSNSGTNCQTSNTVNENKELEFISSLMNCKRDQQKYCDGLKEEMFTNSGCRELYRVIYPMYAVGESVCASSIEKKIASKSYLDNTFTKAVLLNEDALSIASYTGAIQRAHKERLSKIGVTALDAQQPVDHKNIFNHGDIDLNNPHGFLGQMCEYMRGVSYRELPISYVAYGLQALSICAQKNGRKGFDGIKLNIYTLLIAESGAGKEVGQNFLKEVYRELYISNLISDKPRSDKDMILNLLDGRGSSTYLINEAHGLFDAIDSKSASTHTKSIGSEMLKMMTDKIYLLSGNHKREIEPQTVKSLEAAKKKEELFAIEPDGAVDELKRLKGIVSILEHKLEMIKHGIDDPFVNIGCASTPAKLDKVINNESIDDGMIPRFLVFREEGRAKKTSRVEGDFKYIIDVIRSARKGTSKINIDKDAAALFSQIDEHYEQDYYLEHAELGALYCRISERIQLISSIMAITSGTVTVEDVYYAHALALNSIKETSSLLLKADAVDGGLDEVDALICDRVMRFIPKMGVSLSVLKQKVLKPANLRKLESQEVKRGVSLFKLAMGHLVSECKINVSESKKVTKVGQ